MVLKTGGIILLSSQNGNMAALQHWSTFPSRDHEIWNVGYFRIASLYIHNFEHFTRVVCAARGRPRPVSLACQFGVELLRTCIYIASHLCKPEAIMQRDIRCCGDRNVTRSNDQSQVRRYGSLNWIPSDGSTSVMEVYTYYFSSSSMKKGTELRIYERIHNISLLSGFWNFHDGKMEHVTWKCYTINSIIPNESYTI